MSRGTFGLLALLALVFAPTLPAAICASTTNCTFDFTVTNVGPNFNAPGDGSFGTIQLTLSGGVITFNIVMDTGFMIVNTGFPNGENPQYALGFNDNLGNAGTGYLTYDNFSSPYSGGESGGSHHFDGFGNFMDAALTAPQGGAGCGTCVGTASFTVEKAGGFTSVQQLISASAASKGVYFVIDIFGDSTVCGGAACTGLVAVVPEPGFYGMLAVGLGGLFVAIDKRRKAAKS